MADRITFRMVAWTDAAGKYDPNAPLDGNEDNFYVDDNLGDDSPSHFSADEDIVLSDCGMLMAVADGMGGMNAGEVASQIAHDTVAEYFAPGKITPQLAATHKSRSNYMKDVISEADKSIKADASHNSEHEGMGSTLIMAWLAGDEVSVTWIGDSRAYRFNPKTGIQPLSKDHSYVQELADKGVITYEQTFEHPQGNIITRSLGDTSKKAKPESRVYKVYNGDVILLCSDGLSGVLRDCKYHDENGNVIPGDNLEDIIREHSSSMKDCREALWKAAENADWYDNVTAILCQIRSGANECIPLTENDNEKAIIIEEGDIRHKTFKGLTLRLSKRKLAVLAIIAIVIASAIIVGWQKMKTKNHQQLVEMRDSLELQKTKLGQQKDSLRKDSIERAKQKVSAPETVNVAISEVNGHTKVVSSKPQQEKTKDKTKKENSEVAQKKKNGEQTVTVDGLIKATKHKKDSLKKVDNQKANQHTSELTPIGKKEKNKE